MTAYTVTIAELSGATPVIGHDNITNVSLEVSSEPPNQPNDPNNLLLFNGDTITWALDSTLSRTWEISKLLIGKKLANKNPQKTHQIFPATKDITSDTVRPGRVFDLQQTTSNTQTISLPSSSRKGSNCRVSVTYRIIVQGNTTGTASNKWWIDPEIDVSPSM